MKRRIFLITICLSAVLLSKTPELLTLDRIFGAYEFNSKDFGPVQWLKHKPGYTVLESSGEKGENQDIVYYEPKSGRRFVEVPGSQLVPEGSSEPLKIKDYQWSDNGKWLLLFTDSKKVWRNNTRGDYWVFNMVSRKPWKLGADADPSSLMFAAFSPDDSRVAYVYKNDIYVQLLSDKPGERRIIRTTSDGSPSIINGASEWLYEEEFGVRAAFRWSPDSKHIAYWQFNTEGVPVFNMINNTDSLYPKIIPIHYTKVGFSNPACRVGIMSADGGNTLWFELPGDSRDYYIPYMNWAYDSEEIIFQRLNRLQNTDMVMLGNIHSGNVRTVLTETDSTWVDFIEDIYWLDKGKYFTWVSERDGWRHIYLGARSGESLRLITPGAYDVISLVGVDEKRDLVYFTASPENPCNSYLYCAALDGKGKAQRLTPLNMEGMNRFQFSLGMEWAIRTYSSFGKAPKVELVAFPGHTKIRALEENRELQAKVDLLKQYPVEFFRIDIGAGVLLDAWCMKPPDFDPSKRYPALFYVYGEPAGQTVLNRWGGDTYLWGLMLTQQGYIVMSVENRGTPSPRGREWRKCIYRQIGILASADQADAVKAIIKTREYVDPGRIGIWGWSGGGTMTLNAMFRYPDIYRVGMSLAPVPDQLYYDSAYQERYMGLPKDNPEGYEKGSPITYAGQLKGDLLIVHGTGDDNVHYQGTEALINALVDANKPFTMMAYPNRSHGIYEGKNTTLHLFELLTRYLKERL